MSKNTAKLQFQQNIRATVINSKDKKLALSTADYISLVIFLLYILVDFVPAFGSFSFGEPQWIYLNVLNIFVLIYLIWFEKLIFKPIFNQLIKNKISILYFCFIILSGFSILKTYNFDEALITFIRYIIVFITFLNLYFLFNGRQYLFGLLCFLVTITLFLECFNGLKRFFDALGTTNIESLRNFMTTSHSNKNIFAANILVKIPFVIFAMIKTTGWKKILAIITIFISFLTIYFLSARALIIGLFIEISIVVLGILYFSIKEKSLKLVPSGVVLPIVGLILSFILSVFVIQRNNFEIDKNGEKIKLENNSANRLNTINLNDTSMQIRLHYWKSSLTVIKQNPIFGCGLGSWKMVSMPFENTWKTNNSNGVHMHNDFLQVTAETGIPNGIIYLCLFIILFFINLKKVLTNQNTQVKHFSLMLLSAIVAFGIDSFFNFPLTRPTMQLIFALIIVCTILNVEKSDKSEQISYPRKNLIPIFLLLISFITIYPNYLMLKFYQAINFTKADNVLLQMPSIEVSALFGNFPSLDDTATPFQDIKTRYFIKENKFAEALNSINASVKINPQSLYSQSLRVELYDKMKLYDSVLKYNKILFEKQPSYPLFFERYIQSLARKKDTASILKTFRGMNPNFINPKHYAFTFSYLLDAGFSPTKSYKIIEKGLKTFPKDSILNDIVKDFGRMLVATGENTNLNSNKNVTKTVNFDNALAYYLEEYRRNPKNYVVVENLGICLYQMKNYKKAIPYFMEVIASKAMQTGKSEYLVAACYYYTGNVKMGCEYAQKSNKFNYPDAPQLVQLNCK